MTTYFKKQFNCEEKKNWNHATKTNKMMPSGNEKLPSGKPGGKLTMMLIAVTGAYKTNVICKGPLSSCPVSPPDGCYFQ
jgi:hypothetical protein